MTAMAVKHFVYIEILSCYGALKILAARTENPETKVWLVKHRIYELSAVNDTDSNERERCWTKPCDRVFGNVVECNNTTTTSRHPTERRKMSLSGERKEKDRRRKKSPLKVLMCCLAGDLLFAAKFLRRLKCTYSIKCPAKQPASYMAAVCLHFTGWKDPALFIRGLQVWADLLVRSCTLRATTNSRCAAADHSLNLSQ